MDKLKRVLAVLGVAFGLLAMFYLVFACSLTLKNFGLSVKAQLITQRILTPLLFVALAALAVSCEYFRRVLLQSGVKAGILLRILRLVAVVVLPVVIFLFTLKTPFWSFKSPMCWDRPRFLYGWFVPCKVERSPLDAGAWLAFLNIFLWTLYLMVLMGYRRIKHYLVMLVVMLVLLVPFVKFLGIKPFHRGRTMENGITYGNTMMGTSSYISPAKYSTVYSTRRECIENAIPPHLLRRRGLSMVRSLESNELC